MANVWRRRISLLLYLFAVLSSAWVPASSPSSMLGDISFQGHLSPQCSKPNLVLVDFQQLPLHPWLPIVFVIHSSCLGQVRGCTFKCTFSFLLSPTSCTSTLRCTHLPSQADNHHLPLDYLSSLSLPSQTLGPSKPHSKDPPFLFQN